MEQMAFDFSARPVSVRRKGTWDDRSRERLMELVAKTPRPSNAEIAREMGMGLPAITSALCRFVGTSRQAAGKEKPLRALTQRNCLRCGQPFAREHKHIFMCRACNSEIAEMAA